MKLFQFQKTLVSTHLITPSNIFCLLYNQLELGGKKQLGGKKLSLININIKQMKKYFEGGKKAAKIYLKFSLEVTNHEISSPRISLGLNRKIAGLFSSDI